MIEPLKYTPAQIMQLATTFKDLAAKGEPITLEPEVLQFAGESLEDMALLHEALIDYMLEIGIVTPQMAAHWKVLAVAAINGRGE
jgi:hypothetical protein